MKLPFRDWRLLQVTLVLFLIVTVLPAWSLWPVSPPPQGAQGSLTAAAPTVLEKRLYLPLIAQASGPVPDCSIAPWLISPPNGSNPTTSRPVFEWNNGDNPGARIGRYEFALTAGFQQLIYWGESKYPNGTTARSVYSQTMTTFQWDTAYYWRATLQCADGRWLYSPVWSFTPKATGLSDRWH